MRYDKDGIPSDLDSIEHMKSFLSQEEASRYFKELKRDLPWTEISDTGQYSIPRLIFHYQELNRRTARQDILEELILQIEDIFETTIGRVECSMYRDREDYRPYHRDYQGKHIFTLSLGYPRKTVIKDRDSPEGKIFSMGSGDLLYTSPDVNKRYYRSCLRNTKPHIELVFFTDAPYINRRQHLRYINVLGIGKVPVWFYGSPEEWSKDLTAVILPASFQQLIGAAFNHPIEDRIRPVEISFDVEVS